MSERKIESGVVECPHCNKGISITLKSRTLKPGTKAITEKFFEVEKTTQTTLKKHR